MKIRKRISFFLLLVFLLSFCNNCYAANCHTPSNATISLNKSGKHSATAKISGVTKCSGQSSYENRLIVRIEVKVGVRPDDATLWYDETSTTKSNVSSASKTQTVSPVKHYLIGAKGSWDATCNVCGKHSSGKISYKN